MPQILNNWNLSTKQIHSPTDYFRPSLYDEPLNSSCSLTRGAQGFAKVFDTETIIYMWTKAYPDLVAAYPSIIHLFRATAQEIHPMWCVGLTWSVNPELPPNEDNEYSDYYDEDDEFRGTIKFEIEQKFGKFLSGINVTRKIKGEYYFEREDLEEGIGPAIQHYTDSIVAEIKYKLHSQYSNAITPEFNPDFIDNIDPRKEFSFRYNFARAIWSNHFGQFQIAVVTQAFYNNELAGNPENVQRDINDRQYLPYLSWSRTQSYMYDNDRNEAGHNRTHFVPVFFIDAYLIIESENYTDVPDSINNTVYSINAHSSRIKKCPFFLIELDQSVELQVPNGFEQRRDHLYRCFNYTQSPTQLIPGVIREKGEESAPTFGVELEVATRADLRQIVDAPSRPFCICKSDSSISGIMPNYYEIVSIPATLKAQKKHWFEILEEVGHENFDTTRDTTNGMHVHIGWDAFQNGEYLNQSHLRNFIMFWGSPANRNFHQIVAERDEASFSSYSGNIRWPASKNKKELYESLMSVIHNSGRGILAFKRSGNTGDVQTVEVRAFKGIVSLATIYKNLDIVSASLEFTRETSFLKNNIISFLNWLKRTPKNKYYHLKEFFNRYDPSEAALMARLQELLINVKDMEKAVRQINRENITIDEHFLNLLHQQNPRYKFEINSKGQLQIVQGLYGKLADLDKSLLTKRKYTKETKKCA